MDELRPVDECATLKWNVVNSQDRIVGVSEHIPSRIVAVLTAELSSAQDLRRKVAASGSRCPLLLD